MQPSRLPALFYEVELRANYVRASGHSCPRVSFLPTRRAGINLRSWQEWGPEAVWPSKLVAPRSSIASPTPANPPRHASLVRDILVPEVASERLFLGHDLHHGDGEHQQRWNDESTDAG